MPQWKSYFGCGIPQDAEARKICRKKKIDWQPGSLDPFTAAKKHIAYNAEILASEFNEPETPQALKMRVKKIKDEIDKELKVQKLIGEKEDTAEKKKMKEVGSKLMEEQMEKQAFMMAKRG